MRTRIIGWALLVGAQGCAASDRQALSEDDFGSPGGTEGPSESPAPSTGTEVDSGGILPEVAYYALDLQFAIAGGADPIGGTWQPGATLEIGLWSGEPAPICAHPVPIVAVTESPPPPDEPPLGWWSLELGAGAAGEPCPEWEPRVWRLGLGPYDPRLDPMMAERGMLAFDVYGLYLQEAPEGPVYLIGFAGTNEMLLGQPDLTVDASPLPDGAYQAQSLVLMSIDGST